MRIKRLSLFVLLIWFCCSVQVTAVAQQIRVQVENVQPADGFFFTPFWVGFHNGSFDYFDKGASASMSLEALAEEGDVSGIQADFSGQGTDGVIIGPAGFGSGPGEPPVIDPREMSAQVFNVSSSDRFFSYGSMVIPSNDAFVGNDGGMQYEILDANGDFVGPITIDIFGADIWDAGTEVNDPFGGAAFSANGGTSQDEDLLIRVHPGLNDFIGTDTAAGTTIGSPINPDTHIARITITQIPEPSQALLLAALGLGLIIRTRRAK